MLHKHTLAIAMLALIIPAVALASHPATGYEPNPLPHGYGTEGFGLTADFNYGDLTFHAPYPSPETLTDMERYIIAGTSASPSGGGLREWSRTLVHLVMAIDHNTGSIPPTLSLEVLEEAVLGLEENPEGADIYKSPITGEFPRLDAVEFAPGQVYMRRLTEDEKQHFAGLMPLWHAAWYEGAYLDQSTGEKAGDLEMRSDVYYVRIYGEQDVIYSNIDFTFVVE
jgi:hypothetical protein